MCSSLISVGSLYLANTPGAAFGSLKNIDTGEESPDSKAASKTAGMASSLTKASVAAIACEADCPLVQATAPFGNNRCARRPTSRPISTTGDNSLSSSSGAWHCCHSRFGHCLPARKWDFVSHATFDTTILPMRSSMLVAVDASFRQCTNLDRSRGLSPAKFFQ